MPVDPQGAGLTSRGPIGYVLKMYPRFSETFIVSEILAREAAGDDVVIFSLRPPADARFHPELARVKAPVIPIGRASSPRKLWETLAGAAADPQLSADIAAQLPELLAADVHDAEQAIEVARLARQHGVRHLHAHFASMATTIARLAGRIAGLPYSFTAHAKDIFHQEVDEQDLRTKLAEAHHAVTISDFNLSHLRERFGDAVTERLHLVRNGIELDRFPFRLPEITSTPTRIVSVGRLVEKKGFDVLIEAVARLRHRGVHVTVEIIGDGPLRRQLSEQIDFLGVTDRVQLLGPRTQAEVRDLLTAADIFAAPFVVGSDGNADGLPTVLLEAMATGVPVVAADVTAVPEVVIDGETGRLVPTGDAKALALAITDLIAGRDDVRRLSTTARELIERDYSSEAQSRALAALVAGADRARHTPPGANPQQPSDPLTDASRTGAPQGVLA